MAQEANDLTDAYSLTTHITFVLHLIFDILPTEQQQPQK